MRYDSQHFSGAGKLSVWLPLLGLPGWVWGSEPFWGGPFWGSVPFWGIVPFWGSVPFWLSKLMIGGGLWGGAAAMAKAARVAATKMESLENIILMVLVSRLLAAWMKRLVGFDEDFGGYQPELLYVVSANHSTRFFGHTQACGAAQRTEIIECCHAGSRWT